MASAESNAVSLQHEALRDENDTPHTEHTPDAENKVNTSSSEDGAVTESTTSHDPDSPPLPTEAPPPISEDDGWDPVWEATAQAFYFFNRFTGATQWTNPRVPDTVTIPTPSAPGVPSTTVSLIESEPPSTSQTLPPPPPSTETPVAGGYNPAIHGDYDPTAWYAQAATAPITDITVATTSTDPAAQYAASAAFNRFTGRFQAEDITPETHNDENKSKRQMNAFFDVDAAANNHDGKSLKAERSGKKLSKTELKQFKEKRKAKKEEKRRAWLRD